MLFFTRTRTITIRLHININITTTITRKRTLTIIVPLTIIRAVALRRTTKIDVQHEHVS